MTEATKTVLTRAQKYALRIEVLTKRIAADTEALTQVRAEQETSERLSSVAPGTLIVARLGRAGSPAVEAVAAQPAVFNPETSELITPEVVAVAARAATVGTLREVNAIVLGIKEEDSGSLRYKIEHGEGFDKDVDVIQAAQIVSINA